MFAMKKFALPALVASGLAVVGQSAMAAIDTSGIATAGTDIAAVGAAVFLIYIAVKLVHWVRRAL